MEVKQLVFLLDYLLEKIAFVLFILPLLTQSALLQLCFLCKNLASGSNVHAIVGENDEKPTERLVVLQFAPNSVA